MQFPTQQEGSTKVLVRKWMGLNVASGLPRYCLGMMGSPGSILTTHKHHGNGNDTNVKALPVNHLGCAPNNRTLTITEISAQFLVHLSQEINT